MREGLLRIDPESDLSLPVYDKGNFKPKKGIFAIDLVDLAL
jgi:hypothetical protein